MKQTPQESKIFTITTKGCEGCATLDRLINEALNIAKKEVTYYRKDKSDVETKWLKENKVEDFPTTFLIKNGIIVRRFKGTMPAIVIARLIDVNL